MGFHWEWLAIKAVDPTLPIRLLEFTGFPATRIIPSLTFSEFDDLYTKHSSPTESAVGACVFQGWTFIYGSAILAGQGLQEVVTFLQADACLAAAASTVWSLFVEYAKPDGAFRHRSLNYSGDESTDEEVSTGTPLPGEPPGVTIHDDIDLLRIVSGIGVPLEALIQRYWGPYDADPRDARPPAGGKERAFTCYISGSAEPGSSEETAPPRKREKKGFLSRILGR